MIILGIETSCDETGAAVLKKVGGRIKILSNVLASSAKLQEKFGGIIPEQAAREQIKAIIPVITEALNEARVTSNEINAIAVTQGPGLIGSLLVGVETAKTLSLVWGKPLIPINHLIGHFYANWINSGGRLPLKKSRASEEGDREERSYRTPAAQLLQARKYDEKPTWQDPKLDLPSFPCIGLLVSGGHTDLVLFEDHGKIKYLGGTRDDAAGECFDKCARLLGLPYPGGPEIAKLAKKGDPQAFKLPRPMLDSDNLDFSFSGLKTAVTNLVRSNELGVMSKDQNTNHTSLITHHLPDLCASIEAAIIEVLVRKTLAAAKRYKVEQIMVAGGVAANQKLRDELKKNSLLLTPHALLFTPPPSLCTDNASMIVSAAFFSKPIKDPLSLQADPNLSLH